jgi:hypothetical protein
MEFTAETTIKYFVFFPALTHDAAISKYNSFPWSLLPRQQSNFLSSSFLFSLMMLQQVNTTIGEVPPWNTCPLDPSGSKPLPMEFTAKTTIKLFVVFFPALTHDAATSKYNNW